MVLFSFDCECIFPMSQMPLNYCQKMQLVGRRRALPCLFHSLCISSSVSDWMPTKFQLDVFVLGLLSRLCMIPLFKLQRKFELLLNSVTTKLMTEYNLVGL